METIKRHLTKILLGIVALLGSATMIGGGIGATNSVTVLSTTASSTSSAINIDGADRVTLALTLNQTNPSATGVATSTFAVEVSNDETNWVTYNKLVDNVTNANSEQLTRVASVAIDSNITEVYSFDLQHDLFMFMRVTDTIIGTTTATATVKALIED